MQHEAQFSIGQLVEHKLFGYRGVIYDVDPVFSGSEDWYRKMARSQPPKDRPWYKVLVDGAVYETYVAERNLKADPSGKAIRHPGVAVAFDEFENGVYRSRQRVV